MSSYDTVEGSKICESGMQKVRILEVCSQQFINARTWIFRCMFEARYTLFANNDEKGTNGQNSCEMRIVCRK